MKYVQLVMCATVLLVAGCAEENTGPGSGGNNGLVSLTASGGGNAGSVRFAKPGAPDQTLAAVDSIVLDHATIVLKDIQFLAAPDSAHTRDSVECRRNDDDEDSGRGRWDSTMHFRGPFIVTLLDSTPVQIALDTIAPGLYTGIKFKIHKLRQFDRNGIPMVPDSLIGQSVAVAGMVKYAGGDWTPFVFKADINEEFKMKGDFIVGAGQTVTPYVLQFDLASWFRGDGGRILDPNDAGDRRGIRYAIKASLKGRMHGGRDRDHDGHPDAFGGM